MSWAARYVGIPFKAHGRDRAGLDCWGLCRLVLSAEFGIEVPSYVEDYATPYDQEEITQLAKRELPRWCEQPVEAAQAGDVIALRIQGAPTHYGVVVEPGVMLHTHQGINACLERYDRLLWKQRVIGIYRHLSRMEVLA